MRTVLDVIDSMTEEQQLALFSLIADVLDDENDENDEDSLSHYGIPGMRWGRRKAISGASAVSKGAKYINTKTVNGKKLIDSSVKTIKQKKKDIDNKKQSIETKTLEKTFGPDILLTRKAFKSQKKAVKKELKSRNKKVKKLRSKLVKLEMKSLNRQRLSSKFKRFSEKNDSFQKSISGFINRQQAQLVREDLMFNK